MDELTKNRLTGAMVWLGLLIWLVPQWYSNPVNYSSLAGGVKSAVVNLDELGVNVALPKGTQDSKEVDTTDKVIDSDRNINRDDSSEVKEVVTEANSTSSSLTLLELKEITEPGFYVRLISDLEKRLVAQYDVSIGSFTTSAGKFYTVRVGPYLSLEEASLAKTVLDRELRIESIILDRRNR